MREYPLIFTGESVRGILADTKTQTRRIVKVPKWLEKMSLDMSRAFPDKAMGVTPCLQVPCADGSTQRLRNPWGFPDVEPVGIWVKEAWNESFRRDPDTKKLVLHHYIYKADLERRGLIGIVIQSVPGTDTSQFQTEADLHIWRNPLFMPKLVSRITLEIEDVRVERLHSISEADAIAEGVQAHPNSVTRYVGEFRDLFAQGWDKINGKRSPWAQNDFVWVISFKRVV